MTCFRCRGAGEIDVNQDRVNPAFIKSTRIDLCDPVSERIDRLVCELRQRPKTLGYYFVLKQEYCDPRGGTQEMRAGRMCLTAGAYCMRLQRALDWIEAALADRRSFAVIPFPYRREEITA